MVYNIAVCDSHTYFVGENHVLVHNMCPLKTDGSSIGTNTAKDVSMPKLPEGSQWERNVLNSFSGGKSTPVDWFETTSIMCKR